MNVPDFKDAKVTVLTSSFAARASLYEQLFHFEKNVTVEKTVTAIDGKDVLAIAANNAYGMPSIMAKDLLAYEFESDEFCLSGRLEKNFRPFIFLIFRPPPWLNPFKIFRVDFLLF